MHRARPQRSGGVPKALASMSRRTVRNGRQEGRDWCGGLGDMRMLGMGASADADRALFAALTEPACLGLRVTIPRARSSDSLRLTLFWQSRNINGRVCV
jgi:hypothetical protein